MLPSITAAITKASHPKVAVFQWLALHRPIRAAMLVERLRGDNLGLLVKGGWCKSQARSGALERECGQHASCGAATRTTRLAPVERAAAMTEPELLDRMRLAAEAFRPAAPIDRRGLFAGRSDEIAELFSVVAQPGQHAVIYGERGVGKTSLVTVVAEMLGGSGVLTVRANCDSSDDFASVWRKALSEISVDRTAQG